MKTPRLTYEETLKLMLDGWIMSAYGPPTYRRVLVKGDQVRCGLHNDVSSRMFRNDLLEPLGSWETKRFQLSTMGKIKAQECKV